MLFPAELRDMVVDYLCDDVNSLRACSLTCREWLPRARHHLFCRMRLAPGPRGEAFKALLDVTPAIARHIRELEINGTADASPIDPGRWPTLDVQHEPAPRQPSDATMAWLRSILPPPSRKLLASVTYLKLTAVPISGPLVDALDGQFAAVTTVTVSKCRSEAFEDLCSLAHVLPRIECLRMDDAQWLRPLPLSSNYEASGAGNSFDLGSLILSRRMNAGPVACWIMAQAHITLTSFTCFVSSQPSATAVRDLLRKVGSSLRELGIGFADVKDPTDLLKAAGLSLQHARAIRKLHFDCVNGIGRSSPSLSWTLQLLSKVDSPHLTHLSFTIPSSDIRLLNLDGLMVVLSHSRCASIRHIHFDIPTRCGTIDDTRKHLISGLSTLIQKGIDIQVHSSPRT